MSRDLGGALSRPGRANAFVFAMILVLLVCACGGDEDAPMDAASAIDRGVRLQEDGHLDQAYAAFDSVIKTEPQNSEAYARRGYVRLALDDVRGGLADINRALAIDPDYALAHNYKGVVFGINGIQDQAILEFTRAVELDPELTDAYVNRGRVYLEMSDGESALADLDVALTLEPENTELLLIRAQTYLALGDWIRAEADLEQVLSLPAADHTSAAARQLLSIIR